MEDMALMDLSHDQKEDHSFSSLLDEINTDQPYYRHHQRSMQNSLIDSLNIDVLQLIWQYYINRQWTVEHIKRKIIFQRTISLCLLIVLCTAILLTVTTVLHKFYGSTGFLGTLIFILLIMIVGCSFILSMLYWMVPWTLTFQMDGMMQTTFLRNIMFIKYSELVTFHVSRNDCLVFATKYWRRAILFDSVKHLEKLTRMEQYLRQNYSIHE